MVLVPFLCGILFIGLLACDQTYSQGQTLYEFHCANCHQPNGEGLRSMYPPLNKADYLEQDINLPCLIRHGIEGPITVNGKTYDKVMDGNKALTEAELTNLINYIYQAWDNQLPPTTITTVQAELDSCP